MKTITKNTAGWLVMAAARTRQALTLAAAAAVMGMATASCSSGDGLAEEPKQQPAENTDAVKTYTMTVTASKGNDATTRALSYDSGTKTLNATWTEGDVVEVYALNWELVEQSGGEDFPCNIHLGTLMAQSDGVSTTLDGTITAPPAVPEAYKSMVSVTPLRLVFPRFPLDYTGQKGTLDDIAANFDYAVVALYNWTDTDGKISTADVVEFNNGNQSIVRFTLQDKDGNAINAKSLTLHDASDYDFIIYDDDVSEIEGDLTISLDDASSEVWVSIHGDIRTSSILEMTATTEDGETYTYSKTGVLIKRGSFYSITVKMNRVVDLSKTSIYKSNVFTAQNGDVLTGTVPEGKAVYVAYGAEVTLRNATINCDWSYGLFCWGNNTINLEGTNTASSIDENNVYDGINCYEGALTIQGSGSLTATGCNGGTGITCYDTGSITIKGGTITATGSYNYNQDSSFGGAGIGGVSSCGDIIIEGGTIKATGGDYAAGIGGGLASTGGMSSCGNITIKSTVTSVTATGGDNAPNSIGAGYNGTCGTVTIGGNVGAVTTSPYTYQP